MFANVPLSNASDMAKPGVNGKNVQEHQFWEAEFTGVKCLAQLEQGFLVDQILLPHLLN